MKQIKILLEELIETCSSYIQARMRLTVLQLSEKTSKVASDFLTILILIIFFLFAFIMLNVGLAKWISHGLNNEWGGFFIMGGFYILLGIILMVMKEKLIRIPLLNAIIKSLFSVEKKAEDKVENIEQSLVNKLDSDSSKKNELSSLTIEPPADGAVEKNKFERNALTTSNSTPEHSAPTQENKKQASKKDSKFGLKDFFPLLKKTFKEWLAIDPVTQGSTLAYYSIISLPSLLVMVVAFASYRFGREAVTGQLSKQIGSMMGSETAKQIESMIAKAATEDEKSIWASILAFVFLILTATGVFVQLQKTLNLIWEVKPKTKGKFLTLIKIRLMSFGLILSIGFLLLISLVITTAISVVGDWMSSKIPGVAVVLLQIANFIISLGLITVLFALLFKFMPDVKVKWRSVWTGAVITSLLFTIGKMALGLYFAKFPPSSAYGAAGSLVLIMVWISYSSLILFFGAEFTHQYSLARGLEVLPSEHAETSDESQKLKAVKKS